MISLNGLVKQFGGTVAVAGIDLQIPAGSFTGLVGPNGAGKTTTLSMMTGLLRPDAGTALVNGIDVWTDPQSAQRQMGVLPDGLRTFDRLTGLQLLYYTAGLRGMARGQAQQRAGELLDALGLADAGAKLVADYSAGMLKKVMLGAAMIHAPRILVLDEPFESVDPVSAANIIDLLNSFTAAGGTVVMSSHVMDLVQRVCDRVAVLIGGRILASGSTDEVRDGISLQDRFVQLAGGRHEAEGLEWLHTFSD